jgi:hypothetical protein
MRFAVIVSLVLVAALASNCGGSDDKGGLLSNLGKDSKTNAEQNVGTATAVDPKALATSIAGLSGAGSSNLPSVTTDPKALATTIAQLTNGAGNIPNIQGLSQDPKTLATAIAALSGLGGNIPSGGAGIPQGNTAVTPDPCTLLTLDDAMTVLKSKELKKDKDSSAANVMGSRDCSYIGTGSNSNSISLTVVATAGMAPQMRQTGYNAKKQYDELKRLTKSAVTVKGIGDDAFTDGRFIHVLKKDVTFDILVFMDGDSTDTLKAAATRVAAKLP